MGIKEQFGPGRRSLTDAELADVAEEHGETDLAQWLRERHARKTGDTPVESEARPERTEMSDWQTRMVIYGLSLGMAAGITDAVQPRKDLQRIMEARHEENKKHKPPKPPRRPNAGIGGLALGNT